MILQPPRREPRVLAVARVPRGLTFAVIDPWTVRAAGTCFIARGTEHWSLRRLIRRERPTACASSSPELLAALRLATRGTGVGIVTGALPTLPVPVAAELFPELELHAPTRAQKRVAVLAIAAVLHGNIPTRPYATARQRTLLHTA